MLAVYDDCTMGGNWKSRQQEMKREWKKGEMGNENGSDNIEWGQSIITGLDHYRLTQTALTEAEHAKSAYKAAPCSLFTLVPPSSLSP